MYQLLCRPWTQREIPLFSLCHFATSPMFLFAFLSQIEPLRMRFNSKMLRWPNSGPPKQVKLLRDCFAVLTFFIAMLRPSSLIGIDDSRVQKSSRHNFGADKLRHHPNYCSKATISRVESNREGVKNKSESLFSLHFPSWFDFSHSLAIHHRRKFKCELGQDEIMTLSKNLTYPGCI